MRPTGLVKASVRRALRAVGYQLTPVAPPWPRDFRQAEIDLYREVAPFTMTTPEAILALVEGVRHIVAAGVRGAVVECGVWRGGSMMAVAKTLAELGETDVDLYLFDTFEGMTGPTPEDVHWTGRTAADMLADEPMNERSTLWAHARLDEVRATMELASYPLSRIHFVKGPVEDTIPAHAPDRVALLRLDTDWYASTKHELVHLYPRLVPGAGILIVDDYGCWRGARQATDEYFQTHRPAPLLVRIDEGGVRLGVKPSEAPTSSGRV
jgi:O-methyltransferase